MREREDEDIKMGEEKTGGGEDDMQRDTWREEGVGTPRWVSDLRLTCSSFKLIDLFWYWILCGAAAL